MNNVIPSTLAEAKKRGWSELDIVLVTGDAYIDHPSFGAALIARLLEREGYRVGIIDMPETKNVTCMSIFGKPRLFFAVTSGNVDSLVMRYTSSLKIRNDDPFTPDNAPERPQRALITYCNLIRAQYKGVPIVIGGIEASMRRLAHYDFLENKIRRSILLDTRADILVWGMGEHAIIEIARRFKDVESLVGIAGTIVIEKEFTGDLDNVVVLPDEQLVVEKSSQGKELYTLFFKKLYTSLHATIIQKSGGRTLIQYPPYEMKSDELDKVYEMPFSYRPAAKYQNQVIPAFTMIQHSVNAHRGCSSGCAFCSIALHQGRRIVSRSEESVMHEVTLLTKLTGFKGHISDIGGPSANMYGTSCRSKWRCNRESCLYPDRCKSLVVDTKRWMKLLERCRGLNGVKRVSIGSGIRYDLFFDDYKEGMSEFIENYVSGQLKIAPEHTESEVLDSMRKKPLCDPEDFIAQFKKICSKLHKEFYIIPYLMSNHPGSTLAAMKRMRTKVQVQFGFIPKQVQSFFPLPLTLSSAIYYTGVDPLTGKAVYVERDKNARLQQHALFFPSTSREHSKTNTRFQEKKIKRQKENTQHKKKYHK